MPATIKRENNNTYLLRITGKLMKSEFSAAQDSITPDIDAGVKPRILAIFENFEGWEMGAEWGDLEFLFWHSNDIAKIAIVAESTWEKNALAFAGAGDRRAPVKFFPSDRLTEARAWLEE